MSITALAMPVVLLLGVGLVALEHRFPAHPFKRNGDFVRMAMSDTLSLDLRAGANELLVVTTGNTFGERNGGWGFAARFVGVGRTAARDIGDAGVERGSSASHTGA